MTTFSACTMEVKEVAPGTFSIHVNAFPVASFRVELNRHQADALVADMIIALRKGAEEAPK